LAEPTMGREFHADVAGLQWVSIGYLLTLSGLLLLAGALGDRFGRRRVFLIGVAWFAVASALCAVAPGITFLIVARTLQGIGGALLTPASLAISEAAFAPSDSGRAIGAWSGLTGLAAVLGTLGAGVAAFALFIAVERRITNPVVPFSIFRSRQFTGTNLVTLLIYGVMGAMFFLLPIELQQVAHYTPTGAGAALLPVT